MIIKKVRAKNFRNIKECELDFSPGVNLLIGKNAQGKTNIIESVYIFSRGKSFRAREDSDLIKFGEEGFNISIEYEDLLGEGSLEYSLYGKERQRKKNGYKIKKVSEMIGSFKSVLFYPDDLLLVKEGPEKRREFINVAISQCYKNYIKYYSDYKKALENRNALLKMINKGFYIDRAEIESWSASLAEYASYIYLLRKEYIEKISEFSKKIMYDISEGREELNISLDSDILGDFEERNLVKEEYIKIFNTSLDREIAAGVTLFGPHRDDIKIILNGKEARLFASQGQQRSIVLSLKLGEGEVLRELTGEYPVFLLDDVLSELDTERQRYVLAGSENKQFIISSCSGEECLGFTDREINVSEGKFTVKL